MSFEADLILAQDGDVLVIPLVLARELGLPTAAFLRQAAYLSAVMKKKEDGWFFLEQEGRGSLSGKTIFERLGSWQHALGIGPRAQASIRQQLIGLGLLEEKRGGMVHGKLRYRVPAEKYLIFLAQCGNATDCFYEQTAESNCTSAEEQLYNQQRASCTNGAAPVDIYEVDLGSGLKKQQHAPGVRAFVDSAATTLEKKNQNRRRRGDETVQHGVEIWTQADTEGLQALVDRYSALRVEEVAEQLIPTAGHRAPYLSSVMTAFQALDKAVAESATREIARQAAIEREVSVLPREQQRARAAELRAILSRPKSPPLPHDQEAR